MPRLVLLAALLALGRVALAREAWYVDVPPAHWAYEYVRVLYEDEVTDGWGPPLYSLTWYFPERPINRAEYTLMMAKAFRLEPDPQPQPFFRDVPPELLLYGRLPALPWIEAARQAGIIKGTPDGLFQPLDPTRRDAAVAILVRALGLGPTAAALPREEADAFLRPFRDAHLVDPSLYKEMALAVKLRIVVGYPDGTLKPGNHLKRSEAAAVLYRSALFVLDASPNPFSPDGDGVEDTTVIRTRTLKNRNVREWHVYIGTLQGQVFYAVGSPGGQPPPAFAWDGRDANGRPLLPGTYYYWGWVADRRGQRFQAVMKPLVLERLSLTGAVRPTEVSPGGALTVLAWTLGGAETVTALWPDGATQPLAPAGRQTGDGNEWTASRRLPADFPEGEHSVRLVARFRNGVRTAAVKFRVTVPFTLQAQVTPNPAYRGWTVTAEALASPGADLVAVAWPWGEETVLPDFDSSKAHGGRRMP